MKVAIIGAGVSGLACAGRLVSAGAAVTLFDKGRGPGGRMSTRRVATPLGEARFDHGAQFVVARDPAFAAQLGAWAAAGAIAPWPEGGEDCWVGIPAMNAVPKLMARDLDVRTGTLVRGIARHADGWRVMHDRTASGPFDAAVVALPAEQAAVILSLQSLDLARVAIATPSAPCWATMLAFGEPLEAPPVLRGAGPIAWAARNTSKPGRAGPESWTVLASAAWSADHLEAEAARVAARITGLFAETLGAGVLRPIAASSHRWRFAKSGAAGRGAIWDSSSALGACGDWLVGPGIENAWLSGRHLAGLMLAEGAARTPRPLASSLPPRALGI